MNRNRVMGCEEFAGISRDYVRGEWLNAADRAAATSHVASCEACRQLVEMESALSDGFRALRRQQQSLGAPPAVEGALMAAFRAQSPRKSAWPLKRVAAWALPVAAALAVAVFVARTDRVAEVAVRPVAPVVEAPPVQEPLRSAVPETVVEAAPAPVVAAVRPRAAQNAPGARPAVAREQVTDFVPLRYGKPVEPGEPLQVVRIQLPRAELTRLGLPVSPDGGRAMVKADVALGDDGLVKAIRFVY